MQKIFLIIFGTVVALIFFGAILFLLRQGNGQTNDTQPDTNFPLSTTTPYEFNDDAVTVQLRSGSTIEVRDFLHDQGVQEWGGTETYMIGSSETLEGSPLYQIFYFTPDRTIGISLLGEPLEQARLTAEEELLRRLGVEKADVCDLSVRVSTPGFVNPDFAGRELGLSFCPNAVSLSNSR